MAMSNWDALSFDEKARPTNGVLSTKRSAVEIYKNWLYVRDERMWKEGPSSFTKPTIAQIDSGVVTVSDFSIVSERHSEQNSIFCFCRSGKSLMAGIGCRGYLNTIRIYVKKLKLNPDLDWCQRSSSREDGGWDEEIVCLDTGEKHSVPRKMIIPDDKMWIGVTKTTYAAFLDFLGRTVKDYGECDEKKWLAKVRKRTPRRFNQGDAFLANVLKKSTPSGKIGKRQMPLAIQMMKGK